MQVCGKLDMKDTCLMLYQMKGPRFLLCPATGTDEDGY
jgi:hypothetical protein